MANASAEMVIPELPAHKNLVQIHATIKENVSKVSVNARKALRVQIARFLFVPMIAAKMVFVLEILFINVLVMKVGLEMIVV